MKDDDYTANLLMNSLPRLRNVRVGAMFIFIHTESLELKNKSQAWVQRRHCEKVIQVSNMSTTELVSFRNKTHHVTHSLGFGLRQQTKYFYYMYHIYAKY